MKYTKAFQTPIGESEFLVSMPESVGEEEEESYRGRAAASLEVERRPSSSLSPPGRKP